MAKVKLEGISAFRDFKKKLLTSDLLCVSINPIKYETDDQELVACKSGTKRVAGGGIAAAGVYMNGLVRAAGKRKSVSNGRRESNP